MRLAVGALSQVVSGPSRGFRRGHRQRQALRRATGRRDRIGRRWV